MSENSGNSTIADPGPLGLAGFAATTFVLSLVNAGLVGKGVEMAVLPLALFYGGLAQFVAGMWEYKKGNTFGATAFGTYGPFWMAFALFAWVFSKGLPDDDAAKATGCFLLVFTIFTLYMAISAFKTNVMLLVLFILLFLTFALLTVGELMSIKAGGKFGGYLGLVTAIVAWYGSFAGVINDTFKRTVLPVFPLS